MNKSVVKVFIVKFFVLLVLVVVSLGGNGCASVVRQGNYTIQVNSNPSGEICTVINKNSNEITFQGQTPCTVTLPPGSDDYVVRLNSGCERDVNHKTNPWVLGNILLLGPFFGVGVLADFSTGYGYDYSPKRIQF